jgi:heme/copper-type cytochrome/quinol oxidase subunit 2
VFGWFRFSSIIIIAAFFVAFPRQNCSIRHVLLCVLSGFVGRAHATNHTRVGHTEISTSAAFSLHLLKQKQFVLILVVIPAVVVSILAACIAGWKIRRLFAHRRGRRTNRNTPRTPIATATFVTPSITYPPSPFLRHNYTYPPPILYMSSSLTAVPQYTTMHPPRRSARERADLIIAILSLLLTFVGLVIAGLAFRYTQRASSHL